MIAVSSCNSATHSSSPSKDLGKEWWITNRTCATATVTRSTIRTRPLARHNQLYLEHCSACNITMNCATKLALLKLTNMDISCFSTSFSGYISLVHAHPKGNGCHNDRRLSSPQLQRLWSNDVTWNSTNVSGNATSTVVALQNFKLMIPGIENYSIWFSHVKRPWCLFILLTSYCALRCHIPSHRFCMPYINIWMIRGCGTAALWWAATWAW